MNTGKAFKCRVIGPGGGECMSPGGECDQPASVGIVLATVDLTNQDILELRPVCVNHAPDEVNEMKTTANLHEWALVSLAYGVADGGLR